jgi:hypothetical protein
MEGYTECLALALEHKMEINKEDKVCIFSFLFLLILFFLALLFKDLSFTSTNNFVYYFVQLCIHLCFATHSFFSFYPKYHFG